MNCGFPRVFVTPILKIKEGMQAGKRQLVDRRTTNLHVCGVF